MLNSIITQDHDGQELLMRFLHFFVHSESEICSASAMRRKKRAFLSLISSNISYAMSFTIAACTCSRRPVLSGRPFQRIHSTDS